MRKVLILVLGICLLCLAGGCSVKKTRTEKIRDVEFTVLEEEEIPEEFREMIEQQKSTPFKMTYAEKGFLYIAEGYGIQKTSGYSVEVKECYETENAVYIHTSLLGPPKEEEKADAPTYPYVTVKMEFIDKNVVFQ